MIKTKYYMSILLLIAPLSILPQQLIFEREIGHFETANTLSINPAGFIFVLDTNNNEVIKLDTLGNEIKRTGGYGWDTYSFDSPVDIYTNTLNVYIADKNNDRIQIYDKDLNFLSSFSTSDNDNEKIRFRYPTGIAVYSQGDLFIVDSDNSRILKFDLRGEFVTTIGGIESGNYILSNPSKITILQNGILLVVDGVNIVSYDQFGNYINHYRFESEPTNINSLFDKLTITDGKTIYFRLSNNSTNFYEKMITLDIDDEVIDAVIFNSKMYVLTKKQIHIYQIIY